MGKCVGKPEDVIVQCDLKQGSKRRTCWIRKIFADRGIVKLGGKGWWQVLKVHHHTAKDN